MDGYCGCRATGRVGRHLVDVLEADGHEHQAHAVHAEAVVDHRANGAWATEVLELTDGRGVGARAAPPMEPAA